MTAKSSEWTTQGQRRINSPNSVNSTWHNRVSGDIAETGRINFNHGSKNSYPSFKKDGLLMRAKGLILQNPSSIEGEVRNREFVNQPDHSTWPKHSVSKRRFRLR